MSDLFREAYESRTTLDAETLYNIPHRIGPLSCEGFDDLDDLVPVLPDECVKHNTPYEEWRILGVLHTGKGDVEVSYYVSKKYPYPGHAGVLREQVTFTGVYEDSWTNYREISDEDVHLNDTPFEIVSGRSRIQSTHFGVHFPMTVDIGPFDATLHRLKSAMPFNSSKFGVGTKGYVYPLLGIEGVLGEEGVSGSLCFTHVWSFGHDVPSYPKSLISRSMRVLFDPSLEVKNADVHYSVAGKVQRVCIYGTMCVSHDDGVGDVIPGGCDEGLPSDLRVSGRMYTSEESSDSSGPASSDLTVSVLFWTLPVVLFIIVVFITYVLIDTTGVFYKHDGSK